MSEPPSKKCRTVRDDIAGGSAAVAEPYHLAPASATSPVRGDLIVVPINGNQAPFRRTLGAGTKADGSLPTGDKVRRLDSHGRWAKVLHEQVGEVWLKVANLKPVGVAVLPTYASAQASTEQSGCTLPHAAASVDIQQEAPDPPPSWLDALSTFFASVVDAPIALGQAAQRLLPYQRTAVEFGISRRGRVLLADEMGLGKSVQALFIASQFQQEWPLLVVAPTFLCAHWQRMALEWLNLSGEDIQVIRRGSASIVQSKKLIVCSYEMLRANEHLHNLPSGDHFGAIIFDESHRLKNAGSSRSQVLLPMAQQAKHVLLLTGTPMPNAAAELWAQLALLIPCDQLPSFEEFARRYSTRVESKRFGTLWKGYRNLAELRERVLGHVMIQRRKSDVAAEMPTLRRHVVTLMPTEVPVEVEAVHEVGVEELEISGDDTPPTDVPDAAAALTIQTGPASVGTTRELGPHVEALVASLDLKTTTLGQLRAALEQKLGLHEGALDGRRDEVNDFVTNAVARQLAEEEEPPDGVIEPAAADAGKDDATWSPAWYDLPSADCGGGAEAPQDKPGLAAKACRAKLQPTLAYLRPLLARAAADPEHKLVLFAHHHSMLNALERAAQEARANHIRIDGRVHRDLRDALVSRFQTLDAVRVAICSITACSEGICLTAAQSIVFCELHWTPAVLAQCEGRVHRHGQLRSVDVWYLVAAGTLDEWVWRVLNRKAVESDSILLSQACAPESHTP